MQTLDIIDGPRNPKQIVNAKYIQKKKEQPATTQRHNFADHISNIEQELKTNPFVQLVVRVKR